MMLLLAAGFAAIVATAVVAIILYYVLGLARDRYEVSSGLAQLSEISWHELQVLIGMGLRGRGLGAVGGHEHDDSKSGAADLLLSDGRELQLLRVKHGGGIQVDDHTIFDLATRRDARRASGALLATTGTVSRIGQQAAKEADITLIAGADLWNLVSEHLPPRLRERIANRRRRTLRTRLGILVGSSALAGAGALALVFHLSRMNVIFAPETTATVSQPAQPAQSAQPGPRPAVVAPAVGDKPIISAPIVKPVEPPSTVRADPPPRPAPPAAGTAAPLADDEVLARRRSTAQAVGNLATVASARWSTASTLEIELQPGSDLYDDTVFNSVCAILHDTEELRYSRVQITLRDADPAQGPAARWKQCR